MSAPTRKHAVSCREREKGYEAFLDKMIAMGVPLIVRRSISMMLESVNQDDVQSDPESSYPTKEHTMATLPRAQHPLLRVECSASLEPGAIGGGPRCPIIKRLPIIIVEFDNVRQFYTDDGLFLGCYKSGDNSQ